MTDDDKDVQTEVDHVDQLNGFPDDYPVVIHKLRKEVCVCVSFIISTSLIFFSFYCTQYLTSYPALTDGGKNAWF